MNDSQKAVYDCILNFKKAHDGCTPSYAHISQVTGFSKSTVNYHMKKLEEMGAIVRPIKNAQHIEIPGGNWFPPIAKSLYVNSTHTPNTQATQGGKRIE